LIKEDIKRVLDRMQIQYRETKSGFECIHLPSIDITSVQPGGHHQQMSSGSTDHPRASLVKKASKLSFAIKRDKGKEKEREEKDLPNRPSTANPLQASQSDSSSFFHVPAQNTPVTATTDGMTTPNTNITIRVETNGVAQSTSVGADEASPQVTSPGGKPKLLPPIPKEFAAGGAHANVGPPALPQPTGEVDRDVFESMGNNTLSVRFEINIVKVGFFFSRLCLYLTVIVAGTMAAFARNSVSESGWGWMAVSNVGAKGAHRTEVVIFRFDSRAPYR
jgi:hypothetical protein